MSEAAINFDFRFGGVERLYGPGSLEKIREAHILVVGIGGVGSWVAEALARSGIGSLTLVDLDDVCESNINRQIHALDGKIGKPKIEAMAERCRLINPMVEVRAKHAFYTEKTAEEIFDTRYDYTMDAIDSVNHKCALIDFSRRKGIPILTSGGAGGRIDPTQIRVTDLTKSFNDKLLQRVRKKLRQDYGYPRERRRRFKIECVFSPEEARYPESCVTDNGEKTSRKLDCASGYGAAAHVTGAFGFIAAARILQKISDKKNRCE